MDNLFTKHPKSVNETYGQHMRVACGLSAAMLLASVVCFIHAVFPFVLKTTGSNMIHKLSKEMAERSR